MDDIKEKGNALANRAVAFINSLKHTKGVWYGKNFELLPWQDKIVRDLFGTLKPNGYRQYNTAYIEIPKKQGKSELAAAVALYLTCGDGEYGAEVYGCAADRQQASIVFDVAVEMINQCPALKRRCKILASQKRIVYLPLKSFYQVLSAESYTKHGLNVHGVIFDELHAQPNRALYDVMLTGSGDARKQPLYFLITTAGTDRNSICWEVHQKAEDILNGKKIDNSFYPVIYGLEDGADWTDEKNWYKANPSLNITVDVDKLRQAFNSAKENPAEEVHAGYSILKALELRQKGINFVSCPTCGRCQIDLITLAKKVENALKDIDRPLTVAVMGCPVNGPGEAKHADFGVAGAIKEGYIFKKGEIIKRVPEEKILEELLNLIKNS